MAKSAVSLTPSREDFEALLAESYSDNPATEGAVVKGTVVTVENDFASSMSLRLKDASHR
jgi:small subunit ribosomal protein S1